MNTDDIATCVLTHLRVDLDIMESKAIWAFEENRYSYVGFIPYY